MSAKTPSRYWNPYVGGVVLGVVLFLSFYATGHGLGASGGIARVAVAGQKVVAPDHVDRTALLAEIAGGSRGGGLVGWLEGADARIKNSHASVAEVAGYAEVGGLAGRSFDPRSIGVAA